jgi:hypothetical protein
MASSSAVSDKSFRELKSSSSSSTESEYTTTLDFDHDDGDMDIKLKDGEGFHEDTQSFHIGALHELGEQMRWAEEGMNNLSCQWDSTVNDMMIHWSTTHVADIDPTPARNIDYPLEGESRMGEHDLQEMEEEPSGFSFSLGWETSSKPDPVTDRDFDDEVQLLMIPKRLSIFFGWEEEEGAGSVGVVKQHQEGEIADEITVQELNIDDDAIERDGAQGREEEEEEEEKSERRPVEDEEEGSWMAWLVGDEVSRPKSD